MTLKLVIWNMEWMNDLFGPNNEAPAFKPDDNPTAHNKKTTVSERRKDLSGVLNEIKADIIVVVEGPNRTGELQLFFNTAVEGDWETYAQYSKGQAQNVGIAVRTDKDLFKGKPFKAFDTNNIEIFDDFRADTDRDKVEEHHKFERRPLYVEIHPKDTGNFRILGLHLKSKGIFGAYEWSKWWELAEGNRRKILAQVSRIRHDFIDDYLLNDETKDIPLIVCGDINDGPGLDASEKKLFGSAIERLMGNVWKPELALGNALFDTLSKGDKDRLNFSDITTTSFNDPIFNNVWHRVWIDHVLYTRNVDNNWVKNAKIKKKMKSGNWIWEDYKHASDHHPVIVEVDI